MPTVKWQSNKLVGKAELLMCACSSERKVMFIFSLATQFGNLGDCLINEILLKQLACNGRVVVLAKDVPSWLLSRLSKQASIDVSATWLGFLRAAGGGICGSRLCVFVFKPGHGVARSKLRYGVRLAAITTAGALLRLLGVKLARVGVSLDDYSPLEAWLQGALGRLHSLYGVRDELSETKARNLRIAVDYTPDLAFLLPKPTVAESMPRSSVVLTMRQRPWMGSGGHAVLGPLAAVAQRVQSAGLSLRVVQQVTFDEELSEILAQDLRCERVIFEQNEHSARAVLDAYAVSSIVVSNRLHGLLFGWARGAIPLAIVEEKYDEKIIGLFRQVGLQQLILPISRLAEVADVIVGLVGRQEYWRCRLHSVFSAQQERLRSVFENQALKGASILK